MHAIVRQWPVSGRSLQGACEDQLPSLHLAVRSSKSTRNGPIWVCSPCSQVPSTVPNLQARPLGSLALTLQTLAVNQVTVLSAAGSQSMFALSSSQRCSWYTEVHTRSWSIQNEKRNEWKKPILNCWIQLLLLVLVSLCGPSLKKADPPPGWGCVPTW